MCYYGNWFLEKIINFFILVILLCLVSSCGTVSNVSKTFTQESIIHSTNSIRFFEPHGAKTPIYISVLNFSTAPELLAHSYLINHIGNNNKYHIVGSPEEADLVIEVKVMAIMPIADETIEKLAKYWVYQSSTDHSVIDESGKLENNNTTFIIEEPGLLLITGPGKHEAKASPQVKTNSILGENRSDFVPGGIMGGSVAALLCFNPALISLGIAIGASTGSILQELTSNVYKISIIDVVVKEKIKNPTPNIIKTKYKNISSFSRNTIKEMYIENNSNDNTFIEHTARISAISGSMAIIPTKIYNLTNYAIVQTVLEILR